MLFIVDVDKITESFLLQLGFEAGHAKSCGRCQVKRKKQSIDCFFLFTFSNEILFR